MACELPAKYGLPLSRWSTSDLVQQVQHSGLVAFVSGSTLWRWLHEEAIRLWYHRSWIFPRDPDFAAKAGRILDLYARAAASTPRSVAVRALPCMSSMSTSVAAPGPTSRRWMSTEPDSLADAKRAIASHPLTGLVEQVMTRPPYNDARRVFWIVDNCSAHRGARAAERLRSLYPRLTLVHAPVHASWLNQIEIYFSIVQRKVLTPNDFPDLNAVAERLLDFQYY